MNAHDPRYLHAAQPSADALPHSKLGVASAILAGVSLITGCLGFGFAGILGVKQQGGGGSPGEPMLALVGLVICTGLLIMLVGVILGIAGLMQQNVRKLYAWIGTIANGGLLLVVGLLVIAGMLMDK